MKPYTGLEGMTDTELVAMIERSDDPLPHELLRRATDVAQDIEDYKATIETLQGEVEEAKESSGVGELETKLQLAEDRAADFERKAKKFEGKFKELEILMAERDVEWARKVSTLEKRIKDAPATW